MDFSLLCKTDNNYIFTHKKQKQKTHTQGMEIASCVLLNKNHYMLLSLENSLVISLFKNQNVRISVRCQHEIGSRFLDWMTIAPINTEVLIFPPKLIN